MRSENEDHDGISFDYIERKFHGAADQAASVFDIGNNITSFFADLISSPAQNVYRGIDRNLFAVFQGEEDGSGADMEGGKPVVSGSSFGGFSHEKQVLLKVEVSHSWETKLAKHISTLFSLVVSGLLISLIVIKVHVDFASLVQGNAYFVASVSILSILAAIVLLVLVQFSWRIYSTRRNEFEWSARRLYISSCAYCILCIQFVNCVLMIGCMAILAQDPCKWRNKAAAFLGLIQWTCWNTTFLLFTIMSHNGSIWRKKKTKGIGSVRIRGTKLIMDAPLSIHAFKLVLWCFFEIWIILIFWSSWDFFSNECIALVADECSIATDTKAFIAMCLVGCGAYLMAYWFYSSRTNSDIESRSYAEMRFVRIIFGLQHAYVLPLFIVLVLSNILLTAINMNSCWTYVEVWLGVAPLQATGTCTAVILAHFYMPISGRDSKLLSSFLQEFSWTEDATKTCMDARNKLLEFCSSADDDVETLRKEPIFCVESAIRNMYLANFTYSCGADIDITEDVQGIGWGNLKDALSLMHVNEWEILREESTDTTCLMAWQGTSTLVISFKGTASHQNVKTDLDFIKVVHPPKRSVTVLGGFKGLKEIKSTPRVHRGFYDAWVGNGYNEKVLEKVQSFLSSRRKDTSDEIKIHISGHSLGGALASLCAIDVYTLLQAENLSATDCISVYTFGQPRVGNRAFAVDYDAKIRNHFSVIHDQDPVVRIPKGNYKRNGARIIINQKGDLIVNPTFLETHLLNGQTRVRDHFIEGYRKSWMNIIKQQFGPKYLMGIQNGREGATKLSTIVDLNRALMGTYLDLESLETFEVHPKTDEEVEKESKKTSHQIVEKKNAGFGPHMLLCCVTQPDSPAGPEHAAQGPFQADFKVPKAP
ncbi:hypothetical protein M9435_005463 [Picochlorum sp. BPE23]|nr:hypothetical protein M9435_005463 [Picochlorum sp. BPE23]